MKPWIFIVGGIGVAIGILFYGISIGKDIKENEVLKIQQEAAEKARNEERKRQAKINKVLQEQIDEKDAINTRLTDDIKRLQHRESRRLSEAAKARCQGATGAELSSPDAEFLAREAARGDKIRAALNACYGYADSLQD